MLTIKKAIEKAPSIDYVPSKGKYISTKELLKGILQKGWILCDAVQQGKSNFTQHCVAIQHESTNKLDDSLKQGHSRILILNNKKEIKFLLSWYNKIIDFDFIIPDYFMQDSFFKHKENVLENEELVHKLDYTRVYFESLNDTIKSAKQRSMDDMERLLLANYATDIRFKNKKKPIDFNSFCLLSSIKQDDSKKDLWSTSNIILEKMIKGGKNTGKGIKGLNEKINFCFNFWKGFNSTLLIGKEYLMEAFYEFSNEE